MAGAAYRRRLLALGLAGIRRGDRRRPLVGGRVRLRDLSRLGRVALVRGWIRGTWLVGRDHDRVLYRETRAPNPLVGAGEPLRELVLDALPLLLELHEALPGLLLGGLVPPPDCIAERLERGAALDGDRVEPGPRAPAAERRVEPRAPDLRGGRSVRAAVGRQARGMMHPGVGAATGRLPERGEQDDRQQQHDDPPRPTSGREQADGGPEGRETEAEEDEARGQPEPAPLDVLVHDGAGNGLDGRQIAYGSAAARAEARARRELLAAITARALLDRRRAHAGSFPRPRALVTPPQPACGAAPPARGSPRPRPCRCGGRTRAPSAHRARDPALRRARAASAPPGRSRRAGRSRESGRGGTDVRRRRRRRPRASRRRRAPSPSQIPAGAAPAAYRAASRRCSTASGHIAISAPATKTKPATQMRLTSGFTNTFTSIRFVCFPASCAVVKTSPSERGSW